MGSAKESIKPDLQIFPNAPSLGLSLAQNFMLELARRVSAAGHSRRRCREAHAGCVFQRPRCNRTPKSVVGAGPFFLGG